MSLTAGSRLGPYEIVTLLGAGGMGEVYRARDTKLGRDVALKIVPDAFNTDPDRLARFQREAQVLASLNHPNIAIIHGLEDSGGVRALVLELVEGPTLADRIVHGPIPLDEALPIARQIAEALEAAHEQGVIHRDLKPANIKLRPDGVVKVLDFGLAKLVEAPAASTAAGLSQSPTITTPAMMTGVGMILGTAAYMSPEQAKGRPADKRSDIWAFGCVFYEMLTGARAFESEDVSDTLANVLKSTPDWDALPADVPPLIRLLIQRCLEKDRKLRIADTSAVLFVLGPHSSALSSANVAPTAPGAKPSLWWRSGALLAAALLVVAFSGALVWIRQPATAPAIVTRFPFTLTDGEQLSPTSRRVAISPDGTQIVYAANQQLFLRSMSELAARPIARITNANANIQGDEVFSPDGRSIAFWSGNTIQSGALQRISTSGGAATTICQASFPFGLSWGSDGIVFSQAAKGIMRVSPNGGEPALLVRLMQDEIAQGAQVLPGGDAVLFSVATGAGMAALALLNLDRWNKAQVVVQSLRSGQRKTVIDGGSDAHYLPTGHLVYALGGKLFAVPFDAKRLEVTGRPVPVVEGIARAILSVFASGSAAFSASANGTLVYVPGPAAPAALPQRDLGLIDRTGAVEPLKLPPGRYEFPRVSPDGKTVAFGVDDGEAANIWLYPLSGATAMRRLTFGGKNRFPIWSADGERIAFQSDREGDAGIYWQRADGNGAAERLTKPEQGASHMPESWLPKSRTFSFTEARGPVASLWTFSVQDKKAALFGNVRSSNSLNSAFSPDGQWVAYTLRSSTSLAVYVEPVPATGAKYLVAENARHPMWSPDGKKLVYIRGDGLDVVNVTRQPSFTFTTPAPVAGGTMRGRTTNNSPRNHDIMPDGRILTVFEPDSSLQPQTAAAPQIQVVLNWFEELKVHVPTK